MASTCLTAQGAALHWSVDRGVLGKVNSIGFAQLGLFANARLKNNKSRGAIIEGRQGSVTKRYRIYEKDLTV
jgi:hypothetical protein